MTSGAIATYRSTSLVDHAPDARRVIAEFVRGIVESRSVWAVSGGEGLASTPASDSDRRLFFVWSRHHEAMRWADVLAADPVLVKIDLNRFLTEVLPDIVAGGGYLAPDWSSDPIEPEVAASAMLSDIHQAMLDTFAATAAKNRSVWLLQGIEGYVSVATADGRNTVLPIWSDQASAEATAATLEVFAAPVRVPLPEFINRYLLSSVGVRARLAPAYVAGSRSTIMAPWQFRALLNGTTHPVLRVA